MEQSDREQLVKDIDASLRYRKKFPESSVLVYEVEKEGRTYVFKIAKASHEWGINHLKREGEILTLAKDVPGITHLVQTYKDIKNYKNPLLKEFYEGQTLGNLDDKIGDADIQGKLENTVRTLHSLGVAKLNLDEVSNIVLSPDKQDVCLIDLGYGMLSKDVKSSEFKRLKLSDFDNLKRYIFK